MKRKGRRYHHSRTNQSHHGRHSTFNRLNYFSRKHPLVTSVILIITSLILFKLSFTKFSFK